MKLENGGGLPAAETIAARVSGSGELGQTQPGETPITS